MSSNPRGKPDQSKIRLAFIQNSDQAYPDKADPTRL